MFVDFESLKRAEIYLTFSLLLHPSDLASSNSTHVGAKKRGRNRMPEKKRGEEIRFHYHFR